VDQRKAITDAVKALSALYPHNRYIVTSRIVGYEEAPLDRRDFVHHRVLPLEDDDIGEFVRRWYAVRERDPDLRRKKSDDLIATIKREPRIRDLARNPLLLTIIVLVHRIEAELPHERVRLYDKCVTTLVDTWEEVKGLSIAEKKRPFYRYRRRLLERLAYELHTRAEDPGKLQTVKEGDMESLLTRFLMQTRQLGFANDLDAAREEARAFVRLARGRTGLLVERGEGMFGFSHLTFQEYLAACDIEKRRMPYGVDAVWKEIKDHLYDPHWRQVILLLFGIMNRYEDAPTLLVELILKTGNKDKLEP
jgi:predicted NACHT family NTPase